MTQHKSKPKGVQKENFSKTPTTTAYIKFRWSLLILLVINSVVLVKARSAANPDYDGLSGEITQSNGGGGIDGDSGAGSALGDFFDAALLQVEVAEEKQHNAIDSTDLDTENVPSTTELNSNNNNNNNNNNNSINRIIEERSDSLDLENMTIERTDENIDFDNENTSNTTILSVTQTYNNISDMTETTTSIPQLQTFTNEYARKGKKQLLLETRETAHNKPYNHQQLSTQAVPLQIEDETTNGPHAMKRYDSDYDASSNAEEDEDSLELENQLAEHQHLPLLQQVLHQAFRSSDNSGSAEAIMPTGIAVMPAFDQPIMVQSAGLPSFLLSFTRAPNSSTMTATPVPVSNQATNVSTTPATHTTSSAGVTTIQRPAGKQGKQIYISRRKLLPHEQLRNYIEDAYIRMPLAVIVDPSAESLDKTKALWNDALITELNIKIVLVALNDSGEPAAYNFNNSRQFLAGLNSIKEHTGGNAFIGIMHAAELVPYDSAVFISTAVIPQHTELVQDVAITLLKKRIRLYLMWYGERSLSENETQEALGGILGEVAIRSGGEILHIVGSENSQEIEGSTLTIIADALRGSQEIDIPVESTLSSLHVKIDAPMSMATLETPNGDINLKKLVKFKSRFMESKTHDERLDAYVPLAKMRKTEIYKLKMVPKTADIEYKVFVRKERKPDHFLENVIRRYESFLLEGQYPPHMQASLKKMTNNISRTHEDMEISTEDTTMETESTTINDMIISSEDIAIESKLRTHEDMRFPVETNSADNVENRDEEQKNNIGGPKSEVETFSKGIIHTMPENASAIINDNTGNGRSISPLQVGSTKIELGVQSQLMVTPGTMAQLYFEVTNTRTESIYHNIQVTDERSYLQRLVPQTILLRANEKQVVTLSVFVPTNTPQGVTDRITFTCHGGTGGSISLPVNLKVTTVADARDTTAPTISWEFGSRCDSIPANSANCAENFWTVDITAQDWETGIMRLQSTPDALIYRNTYTVGSTDPLKASYIASCCEPKVTLVAYDIAGNQRSYNVDVRDIYLTGAAIAAICLGVFIFLLLVGLLISYCIYRYKRRKIILNLPTYRSHSTRSVS